MDAALATAAAIIAFANLSHCARHMDNVGVWSYRLSTYASCAMGGG
jgi:hypothetical protein